MEHTMMQMTNPGVPEAMALSNGLLGIILYLVMWGVMMVAMMYPSAAVTFNGYDKSLRTVPKSTRVIGIVTFMSTFTLIWALVGLIPLAVNLVFPITAVTAAGGGTVLLAGALLVTSLYQFSRVKRRYLHHCQLSHHVIVDDQADVLNAVRSGLKFSIDSLGCCWALMGLMVIVGSMNILWMALITVFVTGELLVPAGPRTANLIGVLLGGSGVALLAVTLFY